MHTCAPISELPSGNVPCGISTKRGKYVVNVRSGTVSTGLDIMSQDIMWPTMTNFQGSVLVFPAIGYNNWLQ